MQPSFVAAAPAQQAHPIEQRIDKKQFKDSLKSNPLRSLDELVPLARRHAFAVEFMDQHATFQMFEMTKALFKQICVEAAQSGVKIQQIFSETIAPQASAEHSHWLSTVKGKTERFAKKYQPNQDRTPKPFIGQTFAFSDKNWRSAHEVVWFRYTMIQQQLVLSHCKPEMLKQLYIETALLLKDVYAVVDATKIKTIDENGKPLAFTYDVFRNAKVRFLKTMNHPINQAMVKGHEDAILDLLVKSGIRCQKTLNKTK